MFDCRIIEDSVSSDGARLTTMQITYPRIVHSEVMTHRDRARNAGSSRAIPWRVTKETIALNPFVPLVFGMEKPGMQTGEALPKELSDYAEELWRECAGVVAMYADRIHNIGAEYLAYGHSNDGGLKDIKVHKSIVNRLVEPWSWITVVMTSTKWKNFFRLRCHTDAEVHFRKISCMMEVALADSEPVMRDTHLPYVSQTERDEEVRLIAEYGLEVLMRLSTARCARVSYGTQLEQREIEKDLTLFDRLCGGSGFGHWSPHEHPAFALAGNHGPYVGWQPYRKTFNNECAD